MSRRIELLSAALPIRLCSSLSVVLVLGVLALSASNGPASVSAQVPGGLNVSLTASPTSAQVGQTVTFSYRVSPPAVAPPFASIGNLTIDFGDGTMVNLSAAYRPGETVTASTDHVYTSPGTFTAVLAADASNGSTGRTTAQVTVTGGTPPLGQGVTVTFQPGWNLIAWPGGTKAQGSLGTLYTYQAGDTAYETVQNPQQGVGYWAYFTAVTTATIPSGSPQTVTVSLPAGQWVMVGNPGSRTATVRGADIVYSYQPASGYQSTTTLQPGQGAWVLSNRGGSVTVSN